jgi:two-component system phosphate regulon sensor histidine kinase PhoR
VTVIEPTGIVLGDSEQTEDAVPLMENHRDRPEVKMALSGQIGSSLRYSATVKYPMLYVALPISGEDGIMGVLRVAVPVTVVAELRQQIRYTVLLSLVVGLVLAIILGAWLTRRITKPLRHLTNVARTYAKGDLAPAVQYAPIQEVHELAQTLSAMARAIQSQIEELTTERNQATAILESLAEGVIAVNPQGRIVLMNPAAEVLLGVTGRNVSAQNFFETVRQHDVQELVRGLLQDHQRRTKDITIFQPKERVLRLHGVPCQGCGPSGPCAVLVIQDVTEHTRYEQLRKEFVANVSHELKSPLTSIRGLTETLSGGALDDPASNRRFVQLIDDDAARLSRLIDDLLALSQIESQAVPLKPIAVELKSLIESVVASFQPGIDQLHLVATLQLPSGFAVRADPDRLRQVLFNLIDNAIKYNKEGGQITISAVQDNAWVKVTVADTGIGIPTKDIPRIFERFYRVDKARSRELGGTGLGLSIVKHIVEAHGGMVFATSQLGQGSVFSFTIPLAS